MAKTSVIGILMFTGLALISCQSAEKRREAKLDTLAQRYKHLSNYHEIQCNVLVKFAEPAKSAWMAKLFSTQQEGAQGSNARLFSTVESLPFSWRSTPYRCQINPFRMDESGTAVRQLVEDVTKQLNTVMCLWVQSFYADSPLRGWRKGEGEISEKDDSVVIGKGEGRSMEFKGRGETASANFGEGSKLKAHFQEFGGKLYPDEIELVKGDDRSRLTDFIYEPQMDRELIKSFWVNSPTGGGNSSAYMKVSFEQCRWN